MLTLLYLIQPMRKIPNDKRGNLLYTADFGIAVSFVFDTTDKIQITNDKFYILQTSALLYLLCRRDRGAKGEVAPSLQSC